MGRPYDLSIERGSSRLLRTFHAPSRLHTTTRNEWTRFSFGRENKVAVCQSGAIRSCAHNNSIFTLSIRRFLQCSVCRPPKIILIVAFHRNVRRNQTIAIRKSATRVQSERDNYSLPFNIEPHNYCECLKG